MPYLDYNQSNGYLLPPYLEELIPVDHGARVVNKVIDLPEVEDDRSGTGSHRWDELRRLGEAGGEWTLVCLVHNIKKIYTKLGRKEVGWIAELVQIDRVFFRSDGSRKLRLPDDLVVAKVRKGIPDH